MVAITVLFTLCVAAAIFYLKFLIALYKECSRERICYLVRLQPQFDPDVPTESGESRTSLPRAA